MGYVICQHTQDSCAVANIKVRVMKSRLILLLLKEKNRFKSNRCTDHMYICPILMHKGGLVKRVGPIHERVQHTQGLNHSFLCSVLTKSKPSRFFISAVWVKFAQGE